MDKQVSQSRKRPRVLTLCMLTATVSTLADDHDGSGYRERAYHGRRADE